jgi:hypothetical protein
MTSLCPSFLCGENLVLDRHEEGRNKANQLCDGIGLPIRELAAKLGCSNRVARPHFAA